MEADPHALQSTRPSVLHYSIYKMFCLGVEMAVVEEWLEHLNSIAVF